MRLLATTAALVLISVPAFAKIAPKGDAIVAFNATGPGGLSIDGKTTEMSIGDDGKRLVFTVPLKGLGTGIPLRDEHMRNKYLEIDKYPNATLEVPRAAITFPAIGKRSDGDAKGTFTCHGKSKEVTVHYKSHREKDNAVGGEGKFKINLKDYDIAVPSYLGVTVRPDVDVVVKFNATDE